MTQDKKDKLNEKGLLPTATGLTEEEKAIFSLPPPKIPGYRIIQALGEGGMGLVYLAEQKKPVKRRVALKVIKPGMDSKRVLARFEAEEQALALLDHPNVARVYEAGVTEAGGPYFAMEYVKGVPITEHCDREKLAIEDRLKLFLQVCDAVQHAHQKGIIHRDIKPSNILVSIEGEQAVSKVIDFGVAKAISQPLTECTLFTEQGRIIGTPVYMSPEQAEMTAQDIDTRTDIYSLGVLLYELLTGMLPFDPSTLREAGFAEIQRIIREQDPPRPSMRLSSLGEKAEKVAQSRRTRLAVLAKRLHRELEWIPLKAMRKDRTHRYRSASELADDIQNYLNGAPLIAGPESATYRLKKFMRKHRVPVAAAVIVAAAVLIGLVVSTTMYFRAETARKEAQKQTKTSQAVSEYLLNGVLKAANAYAGAKTQEVTVLTLLDTASKHLDGMFESDPLIEASIHEELGFNYSTVGEYEPAQLHLERCYQIRKEQLGPGHITTIGVMGHLVGLYEMQQQFDKMEQFVIMGLENARRALGEEHSLTACFIRSRATLYTVRGQPDQAEPLLLKALELHRRALPEEHEWTLGTMSCLAGLYMGQERYDEAEPLLLKTVEIARRSLGEEHPSTLEYIYCLIGLYGVQGRYGEAEPMQVKTLNLQRRALGEKHPHTQGSMDQLAGLYQEQGRYSKAEPLLLELLELRRRVLGEEHSDTLHSAMALAKLYRQQGRYTQAESLLVETLEIQRRTLGVEHSATLECMEELAWLRTDQSRHDEAETLFDKVRGTKRRVLGDEHPFTLNSMELLGSFYMNQARYGQAEPLLTKVLETRRRVLGEEHSGTLNSMEMFAWLCTSQGRHDEAQTLYSQVLETRRRVLGEEHPDTLSSMETFASFYMNQARYDEADPLIVKALETRRRVLGQEHPRTLDSMGQLAWLYMSRQRHNEAEQLYLKVLETKRRLLSEKHPSTLESTHNLINLYETWGKPQQAEQWRVKLPSNENTEEK